MKRGYFKLPEGLNRKNAILITGACLSGLIVLIALFAPLIEPFDPTEMVLADKFIPPCSEHIFGTDNMGRDIFSRVIEGSRISLSIALLVVVISAGLGIIIGLTSGYLGGKIDMLFMRIVDVLLAFPTIIFALAVSAILGTGQVNLIIAISCIQWTRYARVARGEALIFKHSDHIDAARAIGNNSLKIILKYFFPQVISKIVILMSLDIGGIILYCSSLSFLGMGAQPPSPDWGAMISDGKENMRYAPWLALFPGLAIAVSALTFNMLGDGIRDFLDPRLRESAKTE
ncbi:ABC-type dipeptide/oligopeptide/nickel transport system, permease component [Desulfosporosinus orientis DSM 765]|uniref:ABC-type dipeptide/oligopeptide/nickel transport system, permease component n=1 Tax=Desulfosporosinus orientis (strain ATCC 19365 / DSM 765 / NCIMB 8382 / VKM B-1628 / Singapore I) TaxID=768706 RepID=G7WFI8_DESOD|nr:nickel transporter permease [Desulfosporosinus orientis]AET68431.1 ABC-type dipeptide/oligopeptide/nickel transport system, permease component [Desulfosporosinus orientis DSM 765]